MTDWEDYYQILGVNPLASADEVKEAYLFHVNILHPDRLQGRPESIQRKAEDELKKINKAYDTLKDTQKRREYYEEWSRRGGKEAAAGVGKSVPKPKPIVVPSVVSFNNVKPGELLTAFFEIRNNGGTYSEIWFDNPGSRGSWVMVVEYHSLTSSELPIEVQIEAKGLDWGKTYTEYIKVRLDEEETEVRIDLQTMKEPVKERADVAGHTGSHSTVSRTTWGSFFRYIPIVMIIVALIVTIYLTIHWGGGMDALTDDPWQWWEDLKDGTFAPW